MNRHLFYGEFYGDDPGFQILKEIRRATGPRRVRSSKCWSVVILVLLILSPRGPRDRVSAGVAPASRQRRPPVVGRRDPLERLQSLLYYL